MKKLLLLLSLCTVTTVANLYSAAGIFGGYVGINPNGGGVAWYNLNNGFTGAGAGNFAGANLGTYNLTLGNTLSLAGAEALTFKNDGSDVTGTALNYRVYPTGSPTGSFTVAARGFTANAPFTDAGGNNFSGGGDQKWAQNPGGTLPVDLLNGLSDGNYTLEVFLSGTTASDGNIFRNGSPSGTNYSATFQVVPEPSTLALLGLGALGMFRVFRRRA